MFVRLVMGVGACTKAERTQTKLILTCLTIIVHLLCCYHQLLGFCHLESTCGVWQRAVCLQRTCSQPKCLCHPVLMHTNAMRVTL